MGRGKNIDYSYRPSGYKRIEEEVPMNNCEGCPLAAGKITTFNGNPDAEEHGLNSSWGSFKDKIEYLFIIDKGNRYSDALAYENKV